MYLNDSFGIRNTVLVVLPEALHDTDHIIPKEHVRYLTLVDPEYSIYWSQDIWKLHCIMQLFYLSSCLFYIISTEILNVVLHSFPGWRHLRVCLGKQCLT